MKVKELFENKYPSKVQALIDELTKHFAEFKIIHSTEDEVGFLHIRITNKWMTEKELNNLFNNDNFAKISAVADFKIQSTSKSLEYLKDTEFGNVDITNKSKVNVKVAGFLNSHDSSVRFSNMKIDDFGTINCKKLLIANCDVGDAIKGSFPECELLSILSCVIKSFKNIHKSFPKLGQFTSFNNRGPSSNMLGIMKIKSLAYNNIIQGSGWNKEYEDAVGIIKKGMRTNKDILEVQQDLINAGFEEYASL